MNTNGESNFARPDYKCYGASPYPTEGKRTILEAGDGDGEGEGAPDPSKRARLPEISVSSRLLERQQREKEAEETGPSSTHQERTRERLRRLAKQGADSDEEEDADADAMEIEDPEGLEAEELVDADDLLGEPSASATVGGPSEYAVLEEGEDALVLDLDELGIDASLADGDARSVRRPTFDALSRVGEDETSLVLTRRLQALWEKQFRPGARARRTAAGEDDEGDEEDARPRRGGGSSSSSSASRDEIDRSETRLLKGKGDAEASALTSHLFDRARKLARGRPEDGFAVGTEREPYTYEQLQHDAVSLYDVSRLEDVTSSEIQSVSLSFRHIEFLVLQARRHALKRLASDASEDDGRAEEEEEEEVGAEKEERGDEEEEEEEEGGAARRSEVPDRTRVEVVERRELSEELAEFDRFFHRGARAAPFDPTRDLSVNFASWIGDFCVVLGRTLPVVFHVPREDLKRRFAILGSRPFGVAARKKTESEDERDRLASEAFTERVRREVLEATEGEAEEEGDLDPSERPYRAFRARPSLWFDTIAFAARTGRLHGRDATQLVKHPEDIPGVWSKRCGADLGDWIRLVASFGPEALRKLAGDLDPASDLKRARAALRSNGRLADASSRGEDADVATSLAFNPFEGILERTTAWQKALAQEEEAWFRRIRGSSGTDGEDRDAPSDLGRQRPYPKGACQANDWRTLVLGALRFGLFPDPAPRPLRRLLYRLCATLKIQAMAHETLAASLRRSARASGAGRGGTGGENRGAGDEGDDADAEHEILQLPAGVHSPADLLFDVRPMDYEGVVGARALAAEDGQETVERIVREEIVMNLVYGQYYEPGADGRSGRWLPIAEFVPPGQKAEARVPARFWLPHNEDLVDMSAVLHEVMLDFDHKRLRSTRAQALARRSVRGRGEANEDAVAVAKPESVVPPIDAATVEGVDAYLGAAVVRDASLAASVVFAGEHQGDTLEADLEFYADGKAPSAPLRTEFYRLHSDDRRAGLILCLLDRSLRVSLVPSRKFDAWVVAAEEKRKNEDSGDVFLRCVNAVAQCMIEGGALPLPEEDFDRLSERVAAGQGPDWTTAASGDHVYVRETRALLEDARDVVFPPYWFPPVWRRLSAASRGKGRRAFHVPQSDVRRAEEAARFLEALAQCLSLHRMGGVRPGTSLREADALRDFCAGRLTAVRLLRECQLSLASVSDVVRSHVREIVDEIVRTSHRDDVSARAKKARFEALIDALMLFLTKPVSAKNDYVNRGEGDRFAADFKEVQELMSRAAREFDPERRLSVLERYEKYVPAERRGVLERQARDFALREASRPLDAHEIASVSETLESALDAALHRGRLNLLHDLELGLESLPRPHSERAGRANNHNDPSADPPNRVRAKRWASLDPSVAVEVSNTWTLDHGRLPTMIGALRLATHYLRHGCVLIDELPGFSSDVLLVAAALVKFLPYVLYLRRGGGGGADQAEPAELLRLSTVDNDPSRSAFYAELRAVFFPSDSGSAGEDAADVYRAIHERAGLARVASALFALRRRRMFNPLTLTPLDVRVLHALIFGRDLWNSRESSGRMHEVFALRRSLGDLARGTVLLSRGGSDAPSALEMGGMDEEGLRALLAAKFTGADGYLHFRSVLDSCEAGDALLAGLSQGDRDYADRAVPPDVPVLGVLGALTTDRLSVESPRDGDALVSVPRGQCREILLDFFFPAVSRVLEERVGICLGRVELEPSRDEEGHEREEDAAEERASEESRSPGDALASPPGSPTPVPRKPSRKPVPARSDKGKDKEKEKEKEPVDEGSAGSVPPSPSPSVSDLGASSSSVSSSSSVASEGAPKKAKKPSSGAGGAKKPALPTKVVPPAQSLREAKFAPIKSFALASIPATVQADSALSSALLTALGTLSNRVGADLADPEGSPYRQPNGLSPVDTLRRFFGTVAAFDRYSVGLNPQSIDKYLTEGAKRRLGTFAEGDKFKDSVRKHHAEMLRRLEARVGEFPAAGAYEIAAADVRGLAEAGLPQDELVMRFCYWTMVFSFCFNLRVATLHMINGSFSQTRAHVLWPSRTVSKTTNLTLPQVVPDALHPEVTRYPLAVKAEKKVAGSEEASKLEIHVQKEVWYPVAGDVEREEARRAFGFAFNLLYDVKTAAFRDVEFYALVPSIDVVEAWRALFLAAPSLQK